VYSAVQYFWRMHTMRASAVIPSDVSVV
jgi:hypothetical protein